MKVKQTVHHQDGSTTETEFNIPIVLSNTDPCWTFIDESREEPFAIKIVRSGWKDQGEDMYHVLTEWGDFEETSYSHLNLSQLLDRHPEFSAVLDTKFKDVVVTTKDLRETPNDAELGKKIRIKSLSKK
jgi:hypothetical protein